MKHPGSGTVERAYSGRQPIFPCDRRLRLALSHNPRFYWSRSESTVIYRLCDNYNLHFVAAFSCDFGALGDAPNEFLEAYRNVL